MMRRFFGRTEMFTRCDLDDNSRWIRDIVNAERRSRIDRAQRRLFVRDRGITNKKIRQNDGFGEKYFDQIAH